MTNLAGDSWAQMVGVRVMRADSGGLVDSSGAPLSMRIMLYCFRWNPQAPHFVVRIRFNTVYATAVLWRTRLLWRTRAPWSTQAL
eukprot:4939602-Pyramimonas_sp.AAC.1